MKLVIDADVIYENPNRFKGFTFNVNDDLSKYEIAGKVAVSVSVLASLAILAVVSHCLFPVFGEKSLNEKLERIRENGSGEEEWDWPPSTQAQLVKLSPPVVQPNGAEFVG